LVASFRQALATPSAPPVRGVSDDIDILRTQLYTEHLRLRQTIAATTSSVETLQRELKSVCLNKRCGLSVCFPFRPTSYVALLNVCASSMLESIHCSDSPSSSSSEVVCRLISTITTQRISSALVHRTETGGRPNPFQHRRDRYMGCSSVRISAARQDPLRYSRP
jgi:hypothetical protein